MNEKFSHDDHVEFANAAMRVLNTWGVPPEAKAVLLGLPANTKPRALSRYEKDTPLPDDDGTLLVRIQHLLAIENHLSTAFPHNPTMGNYWITTANQYFGDRTPLQVMLDEGLDGMQAVEDHLSGAAETW